MTTISFLRLPAEEKVKIRKKDGATSLKISKLWGYKHKDLRKRFDELKKLEGADIEDALFDFTWFLLYFSNRDDKKKWIISKEDLCKTKEIAWRLKEALSQLYLNKDILYLKVLIIAASENPLPKLDGIQPEDVPELLSLVMEAQEEVTSGKKYINLRPIFAKNSSKIVVESIIYHLWVRYNISLEILSKIRRKYRKFKKDTSGKELIMGASSADGKILSETIDFIDFIPLGQNFPKISHTVLIDGLWVQIPSGYPPPPGRHVTNIALTYFITRDTPLEPYMIIIYNGTLIMVKSYYPGILGYMNKPNVIFVSEAINRLILINKIEKMDYGIFIAKINPSVPSLLPSTIHYQTNNESVNFALGGYPPARGYKSISAWGFLHSIHPDSILIPAPIMKDCFEFIGKGYYLSKLIIPYNLNPDDNKSCALTPKPFLYFSSGENKLEFLPVGILEGKKISLEDKTYMNLRQFSMLGFQKKYIFEPYSKDLAVFHVGSKEVKKLFQFSTSSQLYSFIQQEYKGKFNISYTIEDFSKKLIFIRNNIYPEFYRNAPTDIMPKAGKYFIHPLRRAVYYWSKKEKIVLNAESMTPYVKPDYKDNTKIAYYFIRKDEEVAQSKITMTINDYIPPKRNIGLLPGESKPVFLSYKKHKYIIDPISGLFYAISNDGYYFYRDDTLGSVKRQRYYKIYGDFNVGNEFLINIKPTYHPQAALSIYLHFIDNKLMPEPVFLTAVEEILKKEEILKVLRSLYNDLYKIISPDDPEKQKIFLEMLKHKEENKITLLGRRYLFPPKIDKKKKEKIKEALEKHKGVEYAKEIADLEKFFFEKKEIKTKKLILRIKKAHNELRIFRG